jgi:hypothetical protein
MPLTVSHPDYVRIHHQLNRKRGPARNHQCVRCPAQAQHWACVHTEDGYDIWADYVPMCQACHIAYDGNAKRMQEATRGVPKSPEHREKIAAAHRGKAGQACKPDSP